jgi:hypothetical protein
MTVRLIPLLLLVLAVTVGPTLPVGRALATEETGIATMIANAKTPQDHEAIAAYYDKQAAEARAKADEHRKMGEAYKKGGGALASKTHFHEHCEALTRSYLSEAKDYEALAATHRAMAKAAAKK